ncbi:MAG: DUF86 domain-containing protein [Chloroflexi bacterium]|nr:DUF86 domain-containing protein [Chloroflexota bacterium]
MSRSPLDYVRHIRDEALYLAAASRDLSKPQFLHDETRRRAFVRSLEVMGEAVKQIPEEYRRAHPSIPWRAIAGMRDLLIHHYFGIDYEIVWDAVSHEVPLLAKQVEELLRSEEHD